MRKFKRYLKSVLCAILAVTVALIFVSGLTKFKLSNSEEFAKKIVTSDYADEIIYWIRDTLEFDCMYLELPFEEVMKGVNKGEIIKLSLEYVGLFSQKIFHNKELRTVEYPKTYFYPIIDDYIKQYEEEHGVIVEIGRTEELSKHLADVVTSNINVFNENILSKVPGLGKIYIITNLLEKMFFLLIIAVIALILLIYALKKRLHRFIYSVASAVWLGTTAVFAPSVVIHFYNFSDRLRFADSPSKLLLDSAISYFGNSLLLPTLIAFIIATAGLVYAVWYYVTHSQYVKCR